jgi:hypothetical protein
MKTLEKLIPTNYTSRIPIITLFFLGWLSLTAQDYSKTYQGKYDVDKGAGLVIVNKFGDIQCQAWDESSVSIVVTLKVDASSQERADKVFNKISVDLSGTRTKVQGITTVDNINNANFSIDYEIRLPKWVNIDLNNQFGDIYIDEIDGQTKINLEYGSMEAVSFNGPQTDLTMKFSDAKAGYMKGGNINIEYGEWELKGTENLRLYSRFSEITLEKVASLILDSQYDDVNVGSAGQVIVVGRFSEIDVDQINGDFDFDTEYGDVNVSYISAAFKTGKVRNSFAGVDLTFDKNATMTVDAEIEFGEMSYPKANTSMNHETVGYTTNIYKGKFGSNPASQLKIITKNAEVSIDFED